MLGLQSPYAAGNAHSVAKEKETKLASQTFKFEIQNVRLRKARFFTFIFLNPECR